MDQQESAIRQSQPALLAHLRAHAPMGHTAAGDLTVAPVAAQGLSRGTYRVHNRLTGESYALAVHKPRPASWAPRGDMADIHAFQHRLQQAGVPLPAPLGGMFQLTPAGDPCEIAPWVDGYHPQKGAPLPQAALEDLAHTIARMHNHCRDFMPNGKAKPFEVTHTHLPHGFIHNDLIPGNLLLDPHTHRLAGILDFELAQYGTFAQELGIFLAETFTDFSARDGKIEMTWNAAQAREFMRRYCQDRPIALAEAEAIETHLTARIGRNLRLANRRLETPLDADIVQAETAQRIGTVLSTLGLADLADGRERR